MLREICRARRGTDGMTGYRGAHGRRKTPTSVCTSVGKGVLPGAVQEEGPGRGKVA